MKFNATALGAVIWINKIFDLCRHKKIHAHTNTMRKYINSNTQAAIWLCKFSTLYRTTQPRGFIVSLEFFGAICTFLFLLLLLQSVNCCFVFELALFAGAIVVVVLLAKWNQHIAKMTIERTNWTFCLLHQVSEWVWVFSFAFSACVSLLFLLFDLHKTVVLNYTAGRVILARSSFRQNSLN